MKLLNRIRYWLSLVEVEPVEVTPPVVITGFSKRSFRKNKTKEDIFPIRISKGDTATITWSIKIKYDKKKKQVLLFNDGKLFGDLSNGGTYTNKKVLHIKYEDTPD